MIDAQVLKDLVAHAALFFEIFGVLVIFIGGITATIYFIFQSYKKVPCAYANYRARLGKSILLGLELLVAGDIVHTVAIEPTYESLGILAVIVAIRTFLSFSLEVEIEGRWPWQAQPSKPRFKP